MGSAVVDHKIEIKVTSSYLSDHSDPANNYYMFMYVITIRNLGNHPVKLISRHWIITDAQGVVQEVRGIGVVGEQPYLRPGEAFEYSSGAVLNTPIGSMQGTYQMLADNGDEFEAVVPPFCLAVPQMLH